MRRANNRLLAFCVVIIHFLWGTSFWKGIQPNSNSIHLDFAADTVVVPLSKSCSISRDFVSTKNITSLPFPIGSRYKDMSLLASEIKTISHIPRKRQIVITHRSRLCANPYVIGRLSGEYVSIVQNWTRLSINDTAETLSQLVGRYNVPSKGKYYLEIIGLLCNDLSWDGEYKHVCLEDPSYMKLTDDIGPTYTLILLVQTKTPLIEMLVLVTGECQTKLCQCHYKQDTSQKVAVQIKTKGAFYQCLKIVLTLINLNSKIKTSLLLFRTGYWL